MIWIEKCLSGAISWHKSITGAGIKTLILSNSNKVDKVSKVANDLGTDYINFAKKPFKKGFIRAKERLGLNENEIASVGDQIFTDVIGAKRCKMKSILVKPVNTREFWYTKWKRPMEAWLIKRFLKKEERKAS